MNFSIIMHDSLFIIYAGNYFYIRPSNLSRTGKNCPLNLKLPLTMVVQSHIFQRSAFWQEAEALKKYCFRFQPSSVKCHNFQVISLGKISSLTLSSTELPSIFFAGSRPFWQEAEVLKKYCFRFQPSALGQGNFSWVGTLFPEKIGVIF